MSEILALVVRTIVISFEPAISLAEPPQASVVGIAAQWVDSTLFSSLATGIAVVAIAWLGMMMLRGRMDVRRGAAAIVGCFVLFGATSIAEGLLGSAPIARGYVPRLSGAPIGPLWPEPAKKNQVNAFDPYAGDAVQR